MCAADCLLNADRNILYANPDVVIREQKDLDNMKDWFDTLLEKAGLIFDPKRSSSRIRMLVVDTTHRGRPHSESLVGSW